MCALKKFSRFKMCFIRNIYIFVCESFAFENVSVKERYLIMSYFSRELDSLVVLICLFDELRDLLFVLRSPN